MKAKTYWVELGFLPVEVGYVPNAQVWRSTLKKLGVPDVPFPDTDARCIWWDNADVASKNVILITIGEQAAKYSMSQVAGLIAHECMHAWRHIKSIMGERKPSPEFEAYVMQALVQGVVFAHETSRKRPWSPAR